MIVAAAVGPAVGPGPAQITLALVIRRLAAVSIDASLVAGLGAVLLAVTVEAALALTAEAAVGVGAERVRMAVVQTEIALVHVRALRVRPAGLVGPQTAVPVLVDDQAAVDVGLIEVALHAHAGNGILQAVAPAAAERVQAAGAVSVTAAALALIVTGERRAGARRYTHQARLVHPLSAQTELILRRVHREGEALLRGLAPYASATLVQALGAIRALPARDRALIQTHHGVW